jgi:hypothetical protein
MKIFGKSLSDYVSFEKEFLILILAVGLARLILSLAGVPNSAVKFVSLTALTLVGLLYYSGRVYTSGFGSYKQLLPVLALQVIQQYARRIRACAVDCDRQGEHLQRPQVWRRRLGARGGHDYGHDRVAADPLADRLHDHAGGQKAERWPATESGHGRRLAVFKERSLSF